MVFKTAYQRSFRGPKWDDFTVEEFQKKLQYRADRRSVEHQHQAWIWDSDSEEDVEEIPMREAQPSKKQEIKQLPENQNQPNDNERRRSIKAWVDEQEKIADEERKKIPEIEQELEKKDYHKVDETHARRKRNGAAEANRSKHRQRHRPSEQKTYPKKYENIEDHFALHDIDEKRRHPPFLTYGLGNNAPTEMRKTHNILASPPEVYPAALRAAKRRQNVIKQKLKLHEEAIKKKQLTAPLKDEHNKHFPKEMWLTEYQRNFCKTDDLKRHFGR